MVVNAVSEVAGEHRLAVARAAARTVPPGLFIAGERVAAQTGAVLSVDDPATGTSIAAVADAGPEDGRRALDAAVAAGPGWAATPPRERAAVLRATADDLRRCAPDLAALLTLEMGKPYAEAVGEIAYAADYFAWYAEEAVRIQGSTGVRPSGGADIVTRRVPVGTCLLITPWNFPLAMPTRKLAPALAAGCTAILKPSELTPLVSLVLADTLARAGLPPGVVNVVPTTNPAALVEPLLTDPRLRKLSFTGSTGVGKLLMGQAAQNVLRVSMELGGNAPFIVCTDADLDAAIEGAMVAKLRNGGQACTAANRFYVDRPAYPEFVERFTERLLALRLGHGVADDTDVGPLVNAAAVDRLSGLVEAAARAGAEIRTGESAPSGLGGTFFPATVATAVPPDSDLLHTELFGPVAPIVAVDGIEEALRLANDTPHGLAAYAYTTSLATARRIAEDLDVGMLAINGGMVSDVAAPFGGVKWSGVGREGAAAGLEEYLELRTTTIAY